MIIFAVWTLITALVTLGLTALIGRYLIPYLHKLNFGQTILDIGPSWHKNKQGTPVMGGIMFIIGIAFTTTVSVILYVIFGTGITGVYQIDPSKTLVMVFTGLALALMHSGIGFIDDYIKVVKKRNLGLTAIQKLVMQFAVTIAYLAVLGILGYGGKTTIPFVGQIDLGWLWYPLAAIVIVGVVNAVNLTDGVDGLDGSLTFFVALFFMLISTMIGSVGVSLLSASVAGGCLGFLVWNFHPAKVFMGDTGSLFLGGMVCALAFAVDMPVLLLPLGFVYLAEMFSVVLQVGYFKLTHGKRLFKMSPIHHHFEMCGWSEVKIVTVFSVVTIIFGIISFLLVRFGL